MHIYRISLLIYSKVGYLSGSGAVFGKYKSEMENEGRDAPCPLCHRPFDSETEVDELIDDVSVFSFSFSDLCLILACNLQLFGIYYSQSVTMQLLDKVCQICYPPFNKITLKFKY